MKSAAVLQNEARVLYSKLELSGDNPELLRKLKPLIEETVLRGGDHVKLAKLLGYEI